MRFKVILQNSPWQIAFFIKNIKRGDTINTEFLQNYTEMWPFERVAVFVWSKIISILKNRLSEIQKIYFEDYIQLKEISEQDRDELLGIIDFITSLLENTSGRTHLNISDSFFQLIYCLDSQISYRALFLMKIILQKQQKNTSITSEQTNLNNLCELLHCYKTNTYVIGNEIIDLENEDIFVITRRLAEQKIGHKEYSKLLFTYKALTDEQQLLNLRYLLSSILIFKKPFDLISNESVKKYLNIALERLHGKITESEKTNIFEFLNTAIERRYKQKLIFDKLRVKIQGGVFISELKNILSCGGKYIKTYFTFIMSCINVKNESLNFIIEIGIINMLRDILAVEYDRNIKHLLETKIYISRIFTQILNNQTTAQNITSVAESLFEILYNEMENVMDLIPCVDYAEELKKDRVFADRQFFVHRKYLRSILKFFDDFYTYNSERDRIVDIPDLFDTKLYTLFLRMIKNHKNFCFKSMNYVLNILIIYINTYPLNIIILEEKHIIEELFKIYDDIPPFSTMIVSLIDIINGLCLKKELYDEIIQKRIVEKVMRICISEHYLDCFKMNSTPSQMGIALEELIRHHTNFHDVVFNECLSLLSTLLNYDPMDLLSREELFMNLLKPNIQRIDDVDTKIENAYLEKLKNLMVLFDNLLLPESYQKDEIKAVVATLIDVIAKSCSFSESEDDIFDLFINFSMKNSKIISRYFFHKNITKNIDRILLRLENINFLKMIQKINAIDAIISSKNDLSTPNIDKDQLDIILGCEKEEFVKFALDINTLNRLLLLQKDIGLSKLPNDKKKVTIDNIFRLFEIFYDLYKLYISDKQRVYLKYTEKFEFSSLRDDLTYYVLSSQQLASKIGLQIISMHITTLSLVKEIWNDVLFLGAKEANICSHRVFGFIEFCPIINKHERTYSGPGIKRLRDTLNMVNTDGYATNKSKYYTIHKQESGDISNQMAYGEKKIVKHLISTFYIINMLDSLFDTNTLILLDENIYEIHNMLYSIIEEIKILYADYPYCDFKTTNETTESKIDKLNMNSDKRLKQNIYSLDDHLDIMKILQKSLEIYLLQLTNMIDEGYLILHKDRVNIIFDIISRIYSVTKGENVMKLIYGITKWFIVEDVSDYYDFDTFIEQGINEIPAPSKIYLDSILKQPIVDKKLTIKSKSFLAYFVVNQGYYILNEFQKRNQHSFYIILEHNKMLLETYLLKIYEDKQLELGSMLCLNLLIYSFLRPCDCEEKYGSKLSNSMTYINNESIENSARTHCPGHYDGKLFDLFFKIANFENPETNLSFDLKFLIAFTKLSEMNLFISKKEMFDIIKWKKLFNIINNDSNHSVNLLVNSLIFFFYEDEQYIRKIFNNIIKNRFNQNFNMNVLFYKNKNIYIDVVRNEVETQNCVKEMKHEQKELFRLLVRNIFSSTNSVLILQIVSELMVYFPALSREKVLRQLIIKLFDRLIRKEINKNDVKETKFDKWVYNIIAVIIIRTDNTELKRFVFDVIIKNIKSGIDQSIAAMCYLLTNLLNIKVLADKYVCNGDCCTFKRNRGDSSNQRRSVTILNNARTERRRPNQSFHARTGIQEREIHGFLDNLADRVNELPERWRNFERELLFENEDTILNHLPNDVYQLIQGDNYQIIEILTERKIMNILLEIAPSEITRSHILNFLDLFCKYKNLNEKDDEDDGLSLEDDSFHSSTSNSAYTSEISYSDEDGLIYDDSPASQNSEVQPTNYIDESKFIGVHERWVEEYKVFMNEIKENYLFPDQNNKMYERLIQAPTPQYVQTTENSNNISPAESQIGRALESALREGLIPEQDICTFQDDCQCLDCMNSGSTESSIGDYNGEYPDFDPNVLNDLPENILTEIVSNYYDERRRSSTTYIPINTQFLMELNSDARDIFEDFELRYREDYRLDTENNYEVMDVSEIEIRDKQALIDLKHIDCAIELVYSNINEKNGINFIHSLCSNVTIRIDFVKKVLAKIRNVCAQIRKSINVPKNKMQLNSSLRIIYSLIRQQEDYLIYFSLEDLNIFYESIDLFDYESHYAFFDEIGTIICDYDLLKKILVNTPKLKIEFTDDPKLITRELYSQKDEISDNILAYFPISLGNFESRKDVMIMNIIDSNIAFIMNRYINLDLWLDNFRTSTNTEILEHYESIMRGDCFYYTTKYIVFMFEEIIKLFSLVDFKTDFFDLLNKIYFHFLVLSRIRVNLALEPETDDNKEMGKRSRNIKYASDSNNDESSDLKVDVSTYYVECDELFTYYRDMLEKNEFWNYFFNFISKNNECGFLLTYIQVFESFCLLRKLRLNEADYLKIINGDEIRSELQFKNNSTIKNDDQIETSIHKGENDIIYSKKFKKEETSQKDQIDKSFNELFREKIYEYKDVLNVLFESHVASNENSFDILLYFNMLNFNNKRNHIKNLFGKKNTFSTMYLNIDRKRVFEDSFNQIMVKTGEDFAFARLSVKFVEEEGVDVGGLSREFFTILSKEIVNPNYCLFYINADKRTYSINKASFVNTEHLLFFRFVGRIIAKGIIDNFLADIHFTMPFYKQILGLKLTLNDLESVEPDFYKSYIWMKNNSIVGVLDLRFCVESEEFGVINTVDLIPNGRNVIVDDANKCEYIDLMAKFHMTKGCEKQIEIFKKGFYEVLNEKYVKIFNEKELELLISGLPEIDVDDWRNNTEYYGYRNTSREIEWFWRCVRNMNNEDRARLLQFVTGTSKLPIEGFKGLQGSDRRQKFQIHVGGKGLPCAHTCFNQLDLPKYSSYEELTESLLYAIRECNTGFGMA